MRPSIIKKALPLLLCMAVMAASVQAQTVEPKAPPAKVKAKAKKKSLRSRLPKFLQGSQETAKERSARLHRECKGRVNAGACSGYTD